jgi:DNA polymerase-3 subunit epsilon
MQLQLSRPLAFFDLEATGLTIGYDRIIEISILKLFPDGYRETLSMRINPEISIPPVVAELTGIKDEDVRDKPKFKDIAEKLKSFLHNCDFAGYNSNKFDVPLLVDEFLRNEIEFDISDRKLIDVQNIFHKMEQRTLSAAYKFYCNKDLINAHSAEADTHATFEIFEAQLKRYETLEKDVNFLHNFSNMYNCVDLAGRMVYNDLNQEIFNFGKHKGKTVIEVFSVEPSYYDWLIKGDFPRQTKKIFESLWKRCTEIKLKEKFNVK